MKSMMKPWILIASLGTAMTLGLSGISASAQQMTVPSVCQVPVCDISAALQALRTDNQSDRASFVKTLRLNARGVTDPVVLQNLTDFSDQAKQLFIDLKEEDWVVRETLYLGDVGRVGLLKYSPLNLTNYEQWFDGLSDEQSNFQVLNYWSAQVLQLTNPADVLLLSSFAEHARQWAVTTKRDDYFVREADKIITNSSVLMSHLSPSYEGTYKISVSCDPRPTDCRDMDMKLSRMSVFDTLSSRGLVVSFIDSDSHEPHYVYINSELTQNATHIHATATEANIWARVSELVLDVNAATGTVTGTLKDEAYPGILKITGTPMLRSIGFYTDRGAPRPLQTSDVLGTYEGTLGNTQGHLTVSQYSTGEIVGTFTGPEDFNIIFRLGSFQPARGVLALTNPGSGNFGDLKLLMAVRLDSKGKEVLTGFMMTDAAQNLPVSFYKK